jgi:F420-0:gamma-glutamyl ligase
LPTALQVRGELHNEQLSLYAVDERGTVAGLERKLIERISLSEGTVVSDTSSTYVPEPQLDTPVSVDDCSQIRPRMGVQDRDTSGH